MEDREPRFTLKLKVPTEDPEIAAYLEHATKALNHAMEVTYREEYERAQAELREALADWAAYGTPVDVDAILARYETRLRDHLR